MPSQPIRVLIADDHTVVRKGLRVLLSSEPDMEVVGEAADGEEVVRRAAGLQPDVILLDLMMPRRDGLAAIPLLLEVYPQARILVLTSFAEDDKVFAAIKAGALGYLLKDSTPQELVQAIQAVARGEPLLSPAIALKLMQELKRPPTLPLTEEPLTEREVEVLKLLARGLTNQAIAAHLVLSERTVGNHIGNILGKLHLANRTQAALYALRKGLANLEDE